MLTAEKGILWLDILLYFLLHEVTILQPCAKASSSNTIPLCCLKRESSVFWALEVGKGENDKKEGKLCLFQLKKFSVLVPQSWNISQTFLLGELTGNNMIYDLGYVCNMKGREKKHLLVVYFWPWINLWRYFAWKPTSDQRDLMCDCFELRKLSKGSIFGVPSVFLSYISVLWKLRCQLVLQCSITFQMPVLSKACAQSSSKTCISSVITQLQGPDNSVISGPNMGNTGQIINALTTCVAFLPLS